MTTIREQPLERGDGTPLPAVVWRPDDAEPPHPVVLVGHGGSGHKRSPRVLEHARAFAAAGVATAALDGPYHGDRVERPLHPDEYRARIEAEGVGAVVDRMTADWLAVLDAVDASPDLDGTRLAYLGMSMGTRYGLPLLSAPRHRFAAAVLGKFGLAQTPTPPPGLDMTARILNDAAEVDVPLLFHVQTEDEVFDPDGQRELFALVGSVDKRLESRAGRHAETHPGDVAGWHRFIVDRLA